MISFVRGVGEAIYLGSSAEEKPSGMDGQVFIETDTVKFFHKENGIWVEKLNPGYALTGQGGPGSIGPMGPIGLDGIDGEDGLPGIQGLRGFTGRDGLVGPPGIDADELEYPYIIPGINGRDGISGSIGRDGRDGINGLDAEEPEYPYIIKGDKGDKGVDGVGGGGNLALTKLSATTNESITAGYGVAILRSYLINSGIKVTVGLASRMRIL